MFRPLFLTRRVFSSKVSAKNTKSAATALNEVTKIGKDLRALTYKIQLKDYKEKQYSTFAEVLQSQQQTRVDSGSNVVSEEEKESSVLVIRDFPAITDAEQQNPFFVLFENTDSAQAQIYGSEAYKSVQNLKNQGVSQVVSLIEL